MLHGCRQVGRPLSRRRLKQPPSLAGLTRLGDYRNPYAGRITPAAGASLEKKVAESTNQQLQTLLVLLGAAPPC